MLALRQHGLDPGGSGPVSGAAADLLGGLERFPWSFKPSVPLAMLCTSQSQERVMSLFLQHSPPARKGQRLRPSVASLASSFIPIQEHYFRT